MRRLIFSVTLLAVLAFSATASAAGQSFGGTDARTARAGNVPSNFVKHEGQYWTWYGPADWGASYGAYGIKITSPGGSDVVDFGASSAFCDGAPEQHFASRRNALKSAFALRKLRFRDVSAVRQSGGAFAQTFTFSGEKGNGRGVRGEVELGYSSIDGQYCYTSTLAKYAPAKGFSSAIKVLRAIWNNTFYAGPGLT